MTPSNYKEEIRSRFKEKFPHLVVFDTWDYKSAEEVSDIVVGHFLAELDRVVGEEREAIRKRVEKLKKETDVVPNGPDDYDHCECEECEIKTVYNSALHDVLSLLAPSTDKGNKHE